MKFALPNLRKSGRSGLRLLQPAAAFFRKRPLLGMAMLASLLAALYWGLFASDRYVSEAHVVIQRTDTGTSQTPDFSGLLGGMAGNRHDQLLMREHMLSVDMLRKLDSRLHLRRHYSDRQRDIVSRLWAPDVSLEQFHRHFLSRVSVEFDEINGVLTVRSEAYEPAVAHAITATLLDEGGAFMNDMAHSLAREQVAFLEKQVTDLHQRAAAARQAVIRYQNQHGLASPLATAESISTIVATLEARRADLQMRRASALSYLVPDHPDVVQLDQQLAAVSQQIVAERAKLAAPKGGRLNSTIEEFQRLEAESVFAQEMVKSAMTALEKGRIDALRNVKKVSVLQAPTEPEYALEPRRIYNIVVFALMAFLMAGVLHLVAAIVRDHKD